MFLRCNDVECMLKSEVRK